VFSPGQSVNFYRETWYGTICIKGEVIKTTAKRVTIKVWMAKTGEEVILRVSPNNVRASFDACPVCHTAMTSSEEQNGFYCRACQEYFLAQDGKFVQVGGK